MLNNTHTHIYTVTHSHTLRNTNTHTCMKPTHTNIKPTHKRMHTHTNERTNIETQPLMQKHRHPHLQSTPTQTHQHNYQHTQMRTNGHAKYEILPFWPEATRISWIKSSKFRIYLCGGFINPQSHNNPQMKCRGGAHLFSNCQKFCISHRLIPIKLTPLTMPALYLLAG